MSHSQEIADLIALHQGALRGYILSLVFDSHAANDVLQETNLVLFKKDEQFERGTNFRAWALRVAHFEVMRWRRERARGRLVFDDVLLAQVAEEAREESEQDLPRRKALAYCLRKMKPRQRDLVLQRYFQRMPVREMAARAGKNPNAISQALFRARKALVDCVSRASFPGDG